MYTVMCLHKYGCMGQVLEGHNVLGGYPWGREERSLRITFTFALLTLKCFTSLVPRVYYQFMCTFSNRNVESGQQPNIDERDKDWISRAGSRLRLHPCWGLQTPSSPEGQKAPSNETKWFFQTFFWCCLLFSWGLTSLHGSESMSSGFLINFYILEVLIC